MKKVAGSVVALSVAVVLIGWLPNWSAIARTLVGYGPTTLSPTLPEFYWEIDHTPEGGVGLVGAVTAYLERVGFTSADKVYDHFSLLNTMARKPGEYDDDWNGLAALVAPYRREITPSLATEFYCQQVLRFRC
jgi:hypothetical protein